MVFINGIKAPLIQVTNPKIKNKPAMISIGTSVLFFVVDDCWVALDIIIIYF
jgi:hypothetical protein